MSQGSLIQLMCELWWPDVLWDDMIQDKVTCLCPHGKDIMSLDSSSWCSSWDSDVSEVITTFDQDINEEISKLCLKLLYSEDRGRTQKSGILVHKGRVWLQPSKRLRERSASSVSSSAMNIAIAEAAELFVFEAVEKALTVESTVSFMQTLQTAGPSWDKYPAGREKFLKHHCCCQLLPFSLNKALKVKKKIQADEGFHEEDTPAGGERENRKSCPQWQSPYITRRRITEVKSRWFPRHSKVLYVFFWLRHAEDQNWS